MELIAMAILFLIGAGVVGYKELKYRFDMRKFEREERRIKNRRIKDRYGK